MLPARIGKIHQVRGIATANLVNLALQRKAAGHGQLQGADDD
jgi:hypothetical protein